MVWTVHGAGVGSILYELLEHQLINIYMSVRRV